MTRFDAPPDHVQIDDTRIARRYFAKYDRITGHLAQIAAQMEAERVLMHAEVQALGRHVVGLGLTFRALALKYHFSGRLPHAGKLTFDRVDSGFPVFAELLNMANDAAQADRHLAGSRSEEALKDDMVRTILSEQVVPTHLQYALSQRLYYLELKKGGLFWARNDPEVIWLGDQGNKRRYLLSWAVFDSQTNLPMVYLMELLDSGRVGLPKDDRRWPAVQAQLMAQAVGGLKLVTIATGFDKDFADLHPVRLRRFHIGPMYSNAFTLQEGPIRDVLSKAMAGDGDDWALAWTEEELVAERAEEVRTGWFGAAERQIYALDTVRDIGATRMARAIILPERPYQALAELDPPGFRGVRKFVVSPQGQVLSYT
ncbi:MAG: hypothetical protein JJT81_10180 [Rubellimicrobium sp.]|nr:hypothetical protein [Rubellimicrobium sp.]